MSVYVTQQPLPYFVSGDRFSRQFRDVPPAAATTSFLNHVTIASARNGTTTHTIDPATTGTVVAGAAFTPTAGRLLMAVAQGAVTFTTPAGWTLPTDGSAVNNGGLYVWYRSAAGGDTFSSTINASNFPAVFDIYEFSAGSAFGSAASATGVNPAGGAGPTLSGLTGVNWTAGIHGQDNSDSGATGTVTWDLGVEAADTSVVAAGTDGYVYGLSYTEANAAASAAYAATSTYTGQSAERLVIAVSVV